MNFSEIPSDTRIGRLLRLPLRLIPPGARLPILKGRLRGKRWTVGAGPHGVWLGSWEQQKRSLFERTVDAGKIVYDLGAHAGYYSMLAALLVGLDGHVYAFEPLPANFGLLRTHLRINGIKNVTVIPAAVSDCEGVAWFEKGSSSMEGFLTEQGGDLKVPTVAIDALVNRGEIPLPHYLKIDIEGGELKALTGALKTITAARPTIFLATHGVEMHRACCSLLTELNYGLRAITGESLSTTDEVLAIPR